MMMYISSLFSSEQGGTKAPASVILSSILLGACSAVDESDALGQGNGPAASQLAIGPSQDLPKQEKSLAHAPKLHAEVPETSHVSEARRRQASYPAQAKRAYLTVRPPQPLPPPRPPCAPQFHPTRAKSLAPHAGPPRPGGDPLPFSAATGDQAAGFDRLRPLPTRPRA